MHEHILLTTEAVQKSLVLLEVGQEGNPLLPLNKYASKIIVTGSHADDIGSQCGGWVITCQGSTGTITNETTSLKAIKSTVNLNTQVIMSSILSQDLPRDMKQNMPLLW
ncbi:hypothetical protein R1sor_023992 [Riccia sorocarpa]|uniref:beta-glucosidase n=1 Tax=Riccia sorocarpa TaxID=122646 RepID=A0ABD3GQS1_9MARC